MSSGSVAALSFANVATLAYPLSHTPVVAHNDYLEPGAVFDPSLITPMYSDKETMSGGPTTTNNRAPSSGNGSAEPDHPQRRMSMSASTDSSGHPDTRTFSPAEDAPSPNRHSSDSASGGMAAQDSLSASKVSLPPLFSTFDDPWKTAGQQPRRSNNNSNNNNNSDQDMSAAAAAAAAQGGRPKGLPTQWQNSFQFPALATPGTPSDGSNEPKDSLSTHHGSSPGPYSAANSPYSTTASTASFAPTPSSASSYPGSALSPAFQSPQFPATRFQSSKYTYADKIDEQPPQQPQPPFPRYPQSSLSNTTTAPHGSNGTAMWNEDRRLVLPGLDHPPAPRGGEEWSSNAPPPNSGNPPSSGPQFVLPDAPASSYPPSNSGTPTPNLIPSSVVAASGSGSGAPAADAADKPQPRRRGKLPKQTTELLKKWLHSHTEHPYPTEDEKKQLCAMTGLSISQVSNWMINARRRILVPASRAAATTTSSPYQAPSHRPASNIVSRNHHGHHPSDSGLTLHHPSSYGGGGSNHHNGIPSRSSSSYSSSSYSSSGGGSRQGHYSYSSGGYPPQYSSSGNGNAPSSYNVLQPIAGAPPLGSGNSSLFPSHPSLLPPNSGHSGSPHHTSYNSPPQQSMYAHPRHAQTQPLPPFPDQSGHHSPLTPPHHGHHHAHATSSARYYDGGSAGSYQS